jgi:2'-5' RNA ligase
MAEHAQRLFFAVLPEPRAAQAIESAAASLKAARTVGGKWIDPANYHLTICFLGSFSALPNDTVDKARDAGSEVRAAAFDVTLDRVATFRGRFQSPCVLRCDSGSEASLAALRKQLAESITRVGLEFDHERRFLPHLTIAYADRMLPEAISIAPVTSRAAELVLLVSRSGQPHEALARWTLQA